jgi:radical SAM protein with 4Fe4S-binding SPASM domain
MCCRQEMKTIVKKDMNIQILEKIVNEVKKWPIERPLFNLTGLSEPLLYDNIVESVRYVKENIPHSIVKIITNGIALERELAQDLMDAGLDRMTISLNAGSRRTYNEIAGVDQFDRVIGNIQSLVFIRRIRATSKPIVDINLKMTDITSGEIENIKNWLRERILPDDIVSVRRILSFRDDIKTASIDSFYTPIERTPCSVLWNGIKLDVDGNIYPCDGKVMHFNYRTKSELWLGNIYEITLQEVLKTKKIDYLRRCHVLNHYEYLPTCRACDAYREGAHLWIKNRWFPFLKRKWF